MRPQFHLLPKYGWMNDPNAPVYWHGKYHMFYQYNPGAAVWGDMHWDHAVSNDMVHWQHLPVALAPTPGSYDADGCFTGSFVDAVGLGLGGHAAIIYTGVQAVSDPGQATLRDGTHNFRETQALATTNDPMLRSWNKLPAPVLATPPAGMDVTGFRDPSIWKQDGVFYMTVGSGVKKKGGCVLLYRSPGSGVKALREWEYLHTLYQGEWNGKVTPDAVDSGEMWECPEFFALGDRHVLIYSTERKVYWVSGHLDKQTMRFEKQRQGLLDGGAYYAPKTQLDKQGKRILWGWVSEQRTDDQLKAAGWAGCMSLPRELGLDADGVLTMTPALAVAGLRGDTLLWPGQEPGQTAEARAAALKKMSLAIGPQCEVFAVLHGPEAELQLIDEAAPRGTGPWLQVFVENKGGKRQLRVGEKSVELPGGGAQGAIAIAMRILVDCSVIEIFVNDRACLTVRNYQPVEGALRVQTDAGALMHLEMWPMRAISRNRLTT